MVWNRLLQLVFPHFLGLKHQTFPSSGVAHSIDLDLKKIVLVLVLLIVNGFDLSM